MPEEFEPLADLAQAEPENKPQSLTYGDWLFEIIAPFVKGRILELGAGQGFISSIFMTHNIALHLSDPDKSNRDHLRALFKGQPLVKSVQNVNYHREDFIEAYRSLANIFDTVLALNATHGYIHQAVIENARLLLRTGGHLMLLVPAPTAFLFGSEPNMYDRKHYTTPTIKKLFLPQFDLLQIQYFQLPSWIMNAPSGNKEYTVLVVARKL